MGGKTGRTGPGSELGGLEGRCLSGIFMGKEPKGVPAKGEKKGKERTSNPSGSVKEPEVRGKTRRK